MNENWTTEQANEYIESQAALTYVNDLYQATVNGDVDPLKAFVFLHRIKSVVDANMKEIHESAVNQAEKFNEKTFKFEGYEITKKAAAGRWSFDHLQDWNDHKKAISEIEDKHKQAFTIAEKGGHFVDENGEPVEPAKYTPGKETISLKPLK